MRDLDAFAEPEDLYLLEEMLAVEVHHVGSLVLPQTSIQTALVVLFDVLEGRRVFYFCVVVLGLNGLGVLSRSEDGWQLDSFFLLHGCLLYTSPSPRDLSTSRMPSSA